MSSYCYVQSCSQGCCNIDGVCPTSFGSYNQQNCYYWYYDWYWTVWATWWIYVLIAVGSLVVLACIIACIAACVRNRRVKGQNTVIINDGDASNGQYNQYGQQGYNQQGYNNQQYYQGQNYEMTGNFNQPRPTNGTTYMGQPVYQNGPNAPFNGEQNNIYQWMIQNFNLIV